MNILLLEPFFSGSHQKWAVAYQKASRHKVTILSLPGRHWKWRMYGGAVSLAQQFLTSDIQADLIIASDMLDLTTFYSLCRKRLTGIPLAVYFHENQITYPWSPDDPDLKLRRDNQYGFINFTTALSADALFFNSQFHQHSFLDALPGFLKQFPDHQNLESIRGIAAKSQTLWLGLDLQKFDSHRVSPENDRPLLLWNHRWEYDKNPEVFFEVLFKLSEEGLDFGLVVLGESFKKEPPIFAEARHRLADHMVHFGHAPDFASYAQWLWRADILPVTSNQDFFGGSVVEAIYCQCFPLLPQRLAYPEHLPDDLKEACLYTDDDQLLQRLRKKIMEFPENKSPGSLQNFVRRYDWSNLATKYDTIFEQLKAD